MIKALIEHKEWDSDFFNQEIYSVDVADFPLFHSEIFDSLENALVQIKIPAYRMDIVDWVQEQGFVLAESDISFTSKSLSKTSCDESTIQHAQIDDLDEIQQLAADSFVYSRFRSPWFEKNDSSRFYSEWSRKAVLHQFDDVCLKLENSNSICGIITAKRLSKMEARIGLICVREQFQGKNIGTDLLKAIEQWAITQNIEKIHVATQGANQRACSFYLRNNYHLSSINYWFYKRVS